MKSNPKVCVVGSINMDMQTITDKLPVQGQTVLGKSFKTFPGGKGANQAIAAARFSADVSLVGAVGNDSFGKSLLDYFKSEYIDIDGIEVVNEEPTGVATITISNNDNRIIVSPGANSKISPELISKSKETLINSDLILVQFEIPIKTIEYIVHIAFEYNIPIIINPAPYQKLSEEILARASFFTPNEGEYLAMSKSPLYQKIKNKLIITKGDKGAEYFSPSGQKILIPAYQVVVRDTTGAGDTFNGVLATELAHGTHIDKAISFANAAAALAVTQEGAQTGMPYKNEVINFLKNKTNEFET